VPDLPRGQGAAQSGSALRPVPRLPAGDHGRKNGRAFGAAGDRVRYRIPVTASAPYRVEVELLYQSIGYRWAHNLEPYKAPEPARFVSYYNASSAGSSVVVATASAATGSPRD